MNEKTYSIVVPVFNEEKNLNELHARLVRVLLPLGSEFEIIFIDDGSTDGSLQKIEDLRRNDPRVKYLSFSRNFGHEAASTAGLDHALGHAVILMDADLQDPPEAIPDMIARWKEGYDVVYACRRSRAGESLSRRLTSFLFYRLIDRLTNVTIPVDTGDFRLLDQRVVKDFRRCRERNRFVRGLVSWVGYRQIGVSFDREPRRAGKSKYDVVKRIILSFDAITGYSIVPLRLALILGFFVVTMSLIGGLAVIIQKLFLGLPIPGYAFLVVSMFFLGGSQLFLLGVVGEYVGKMYIEIQRRPLYLVKKKEGWKKETDGSLID